MTSKPLYHLSRSTIVRLTLALLCTSLVLRGGYYFLTKGFCLKRIQAQVSFPESLSLPPPTSEDLKTLCSACNQPFKYFVKGSQAYAFISEDGKYILKLLKLHHLQSIAWIENLPCPNFCINYRNALINRRRFRTHLTLTSYKLAAYNLKDECGLLFTQILPSKTYSLPITLIDTLGRSYTIDLAQSSFALQKRADLVLPSLEKWISVGDLLSAKEALTSIISLIKARASKGIQDIDPDLHKNAGLIGTTAIHIDIGSFHQNPHIHETEPLKNDLKKIFARLLSWLEPRSKELATYVEESIESLDCPKWQAPKQDTSLS
jgi:hypothetical protein